MNELFTEFLFSKHYLVSHLRKHTNAFETLFSLARLFNIRVISGAHLAEKEMILTAQRCLGCEVPLPFYRGFPQSVRQLTPKALLFDQLLHYWHTAEHSLLEADFNRIAFREQSEIKDFSIVTQKEAKDILRRSIDDLLASTRPLSKHHYGLVLEYIRVYNYKIPHCASRDTAVQLLLDTRDLTYAAFLQLSDVIRFLDHLNYRDYGNRNLKKLNLRNRDRIFLTRLIDIIFRADRCNIAECFEKKKIWNGLLHHIHYRPVNKQAKAFADAIRGKGNISAYSAFENQMNAGQIREAVQTLRQAKGSGALLRNLTYILSRCESEEDVQAVMDSLDSRNSLVLMQLFCHYSKNYSQDTLRTFKFTKFNMLRIHTETFDEYMSRQSAVSTRIQQMVLERLWKNLERNLRGHLGKVYIDPAMAQIAAPLQETTASGGYGVLPRGTRIPIQAGKKIRCFTYWERINDIDLSAIALCGNNRQIEFSWRTMHARQSDAITFSGDQVRGFCGGSEYFDVDPAAFHARYPQAEYLIFCNNVYSLSSFKNCLCKAGYMDRDILDSGKAFEPKTVSTSFMIDCNSSEVFLFALDLRENCLIWLNISRDSNTHIAGNSFLHYLRDYLGPESMVSMHQLFTMLASEVVEDPTQADVVVSDKVLPIHDGAEHIRSCDTDRILALLNS